MKEVFYGIVFLGIVFGAGYFFGHTNAKEKIVYRPKTEYIKDPDSVPKSTLDSEVANVKKSSYNAGYTEGRKAGVNEGHESGYMKGMEEGRKAGIGEGYQSGYTQGTEYGKSLILDQIDLRVKEAEKTNKNVPLFRVKRE
jgi:flagellar biosynthesis/type III secretory pathway protein FliH